MDTYVIEVFVGEDDKGYYRLASSNGNTLATSESYATKSNAKRAGKKVAAGLGIGYKVL